jgi:pyridoxal phosphate enzyme (YggS family)
MTDTDQLAAAIAGRWAQVQARIDAAAAAGGRDPAGVRVVAVTKGFGSEVVRAARRAGLVRLGVDRVQEAEPKVAAAADAEWHLVGHLQSNKARRAVALFPWLEAIDSVALLERVDVLAGELGLRPRVLLQVNLTGSASQHGFELDELGPGARDRTGLARSVASIRAVQVQGLMGIGPLTSQADASRAAFARLRQVRDGLEQATGKPLPELSMGMSADLEFAVAEGATLVRAGTALFGERPTD